MKQSLSGANQSLVLWARILYPITRRNLYNFLKNIKLLVKRVTTKFGAAKKPNHLVPKVTRLSLSRPVAFRLDLTIEVGFFLVFPIQFIHIHYAKIMQS